MAYYSGYPGEPYWVPEYTADEGDYAQPMMGNWALPPPPNLTEGMSAVIFEPKYLPPSQQGNGPLPFQNGMMEHNYAYSDNSAMVPDNIGPNHNPLYNAFLVQFLGERTFDTSLTTTFANLYQPQYFGGNLPQPGHIACIPYRNNLGLPLPEPIGVPVEFDMRQQDPRYRPGLLNDPPRFYPPNPSTHGNNWRPRRRHNGQNRTRQVSASTAGPIMQPPAPTELPGPSAVSQPTPFCFSQLNPNCEPFVPRNFAENNGNHSNSIPDAQYDMTSDENIDEQSSVQYSNDPTIPFDTYQEFQETYEETLCTADETGKLAFVPSDDTEVAEELPANNNL